MRFAGVMMALGAFRFGMQNDAYQKLSRSAPFRWEKVMRQGRAPALQFAGPDAESITLEGIIYPHFKGGLKQVDLMRAQAGLGVPLMMVDGLGWVWKRWAITEVRDTRSYFMADGAPRKIEFSMTLQSYGRDGTLAAGLGQIGRLF
jgi:phage protein U